MAGIKRKWKSISFIIKNKSGAGEACVLWLLRYYNRIAGKRAPANYHHVQKDSDSLKGMLKLAEEEGFEVGCWQAGFETINSILHPVILVVDDPELGKNNYVVLCKVDQHKTGPAYILYHPMKGMLSLSKAALEQLWDSGVYLTMELTKQESDTPESKQIFKWLLQPMAGKWPIFATAATINVIQASAAITLLFMLRSLIDSWLPSIDGKLPVDILIKIFVLLTTLLITQIFYENFKNVSSYISSSYQLNNFSLNIFNTVTDLSKEKNRKYLWGNYMELTRDNTQSFSLLLHTFSTILFLLLISSYLLTTDLKTFSCLFLLSGIIFFIVNKTKVNITDKKSKLSQYQTVLRSGFNSMLESINAITDSNRENEFLLKFKKENYSYQEQLYQLKKIRNRFVTYKNVSFVSIFFLILLINLQGLKSREVMPGQFSLSLILSACFAFLLNRLSFSMLEYDELKTGYFENNKEVRNQATSIKKTSNPVFAEDPESIKIYAAESGEPALYFKAIKGEVNYLQPVDFKSRKDLTLTFSQPESSENYRIIINDNFNYQEIASATRKKMVTTLLCEPFIFNESIAYNIAFNDVTHIHEALLRFIFKYKLDNYIKSFPESLATVIGPSGYGLTTIDKIIIAIARALYQGAGILLIDEQYLETEATSTIILEEFLYQIKDDITIIILCHPHPTAPSFLNKTFEQNKPSVYE
ncbi:cysteine peptidase family C39 domain-containing protein [Pedobacter cryoconitis]|uniref:ATP-binding cassette subfamily B protein n=1 Tax=Pedobacter cryoconitis TaxID=188932 RepID=A0A7X0MHN6_9SPHI|nr:cysteine peptidase family C39 domain-containing protein [Pedobacter cryoconitis]MBB6499051.1 ATP-binding cassette subfamily B protein [Pedobacter cryoconitis]